MKRKYSGFYFRLKEVRILYNFCTHCNLKIANSVLANIAKSTNTSGFCLTHLFTYLDIPGGIAGLAIHSKPNGIALCYPQTNTGFTTFLVHQVLIVYTNSFLNMNFTNVRIMSYSKCSNWRRILQLSLYFLLFCLGKLNQTQITDL